MSDSLVVLLGAGASLGARARAEVPPPLGANLGRYMLQWLRSNRPANMLRFAKSKLHDPLAGCELYAGERLWTEPAFSELFAALETLAESELAASPSESTPFELLMDSWWSRHDGRALLHLAQRTLCYSFLVGRHCGFLFRPDLMDTLIRHLSTVRNVTFISLNYDLLLEDALTRAKRAYTYPRIPGVEGTIFTSNGQGAPATIYKPHGSINWLSLRSDGTGSTLEIASKNSKPVKYMKQSGILVAQTHGTYVSQDRTSLFYELEEAIDVEMPVIAVYGAGKHAIENPEHLDGHRSACREMISDLSNPDVLAIGVRPVSSVDDPVLHKIVASLAGSAGQKEYVSPSSPECDHFERLGFASHRMTFQEWTDSLPATKHCSGRDPLLRLGSRR
jgi:hypothetical protein